MSTTADPGLSPGDQLAHFQVTGRLGRGATATVYDARDLRTGRPVALKVLHPELARDPDHAERFRRGARGQAELDHPHIVEVLESGEAPGGLYIAMQRIEGPSLAELLCGDARDPATVLDLLAQVAGALDAAHRAGVVHRDVTPSNILTDGGGRAWLSDFGSARAPVDAALTLPRGLVGTLGYLAPEVIRGAPAGPAADVYALAAVGYECLAGHPPFVRDHPAAMLYAHTSESPPPLGPPAPPAVDAALARGLAKAPEDRPSSARALIGALSAAVGEPPHPAAPTPARRRARLALAGLAIAAAAAVGATVLTGLGARRHRPAAPVRPSLATLGVASPAPARPVSCPRAPRECTLAEVRLPGADLHPGHRGEIVRWSVAGARGELALAVLSVHGGRVHQLARSEDVFVEDRVTHTFDTRLPINRGDMVAVDLIGGASIGARSAVSGARLTMWSPPITGDLVGIGRGRRRLEGGELQLRAEVSAAPLRAISAQLRGAAARDAPRGRVLIGRRLRFSDGRSSRVALVALPGEIALDEFRGGRRRVRMTVPGALPGGRPVTFNLDHSPTEPDELGVYVQYVNPDSARLVEHYVLIRPDRFQLVD
jgi:hypothetical protein